MRINFFFPGIPFAKQSIRFSNVHDRQGNVVTFTDKNGKRKALTKKHQPKKLIEQEKSIKVMAISQLPPGFKPFTGAVHIRRIFFKFPPLKSFTKKKLMEIESGITQYKTTQPDLTDNLKKGIYDALEGIVYMNDAQICTEMNSMKCYSFRPGIHITIDGEYL